MHKWLGLTTVIVTLVRYQAGNSESELELVGNIVTNPYGI